MTTNRYITLTDTAGNSKRFSVIFGGYRPTIDKTMQIDRTAGGGLDIAMGAIYESRGYVIRTRETVTDANYGTLEDLKTFYRLSNPEATPSNVLTLTDHYGETFDGILSGTLEETSFTVILEGEEANFSIPIQFQVIP